MLRFANRNGASEQRQKSEGNDCHASAEARIRQAGRIAVVEAELVVAPARARNVAVGEAPADSVVHRTPVKVVTTRFQEEHGLEDFGFKARIPLCAKLLVLIA